MTNTTRWWCGCAVVIGSMLALMAGSNWAEEKKSPGKHDAKVLSEALKEVINVGAKMFNEQGDHAGCYRLFQGSLLAVKPFVAVEFQKRIDEGIGNAEKMGSFAERAFELRKVLDEIRASANPAGKAGDKKDDKKDDGKDKKQEEKKGKKDDGTDKKEEKKGEPGGKTGLVSGTITFEDKPVSDGYSVTFIGKEKKKFTIGIQKDGTYKLADPLPVGEYRVVIEPIADAKPKIVLPPRYASEETSGLTVSVAADKNNIHLSLVK